MQRVGVLNGENITYDHDIAGLIRSITDGGIVEGGDISNNKIQPLQAVVPCLRANGQKLMLFFESDEEFDLNSVDGKVYVEVSQTAIDDGSENNEDGTGIAQITVGSNWPTKNFVKLYSISNGVITDERVIQPKLSEILELQLRMDDAEADIAELQVAGATDHLEDRLLTGTNYTMDELMFRQLTPTYANSTNTINVGDVAADTELHIQRLGSGVASDTLNLKVKMNGAPTTSLIVEVRTGVKVIEDNGESYWYGDSSSVIASATLPYTAFTTDWQDIEVTLDDTFGGTEGELLDIVVYQNNHIVNASNYYVLGVDATQKSDAFQVLKVNGATIVRSNLMPYCISDGFADVLAERVSSKGAYALPRVLKEIGEITRLTTFGRHIDGVWLEHVSEDYIDYKPQGYKTVTCYINEGVSDPASMVTLGDDCADWTSDDWDDFFDHHPYLTDENGDIFKELDPDDYTKDINGNDVTTYLDGTTGTYNAMVRFPRRGISVERDETNTDIIICRMTDNPSNYDDGFHYYAFTRGPVDLSAADTSADEEQYAIDFFDIGAFKAYIKDSKMRSISGQIPTTTTYIYDFRTAARALGVNFGQSGVFQLGQRQLMYVFKYQNLNSQATIGRGFVDKTSGWSSTGCYTGATNAKGMDWGNTASGTDIVENRMKLFGVEDVYGNVWEWIDGFNISSYIAYLSCDFDNWVHDSFSAPYYNVGTCPSTSDRYITKVMGTTKGMFLPSANGGSDSTYYCDNMWINSGSRVARSGAVRADASGAGVFVRSLSVASSDRGATVGGRLMFLPSV